MTLFIAFPIADEWHMILGSIILYIDLIYFLYFNEIKLENNKILVGIDIYLIIFIVLNISYNIFSIKNEISKINYNKQSNFYLTFVSDYKKINNVEKFIESKNNKCLVVSPEAGIYSLELNLGSHGFFDEPFNGNLGSDQLKKMIQGLEKYEDYYILIHTNKKYNQEIDEFRSYIIENYNEISKVEDFTVYKK